MLGENQMMEVLILDQGTEQYRSVSSPPMVSLWWAETSHTHKQVSTGKILFFDTLGLLQKKLGRQHFQCQRGGLAFYLLLRCTGALQGSPRNLLGFKGAVGGSLFTAISHGRIGDVVQTSHTPGKENRTEEALVCCL